MFQNAHWEALFHQGYTIVSGAIDDEVLRAAQATARALNDNHPDGGWERTKNELWREIRHCPHPDFLAITTGVLHPLACEILESVRPDDRIQFASTMPGFSAKGIGRNFHIDGGTGPSLAVFNVLFGVALTPVASDTAGGFHVLPGSHAAVRHGVRATAHRCAGALGRGQARHPARAAAHGADGGAAPAARRHRRGAQLPGARHIGQHDRRATRHALPAPRRHPAGGPRDPGSRPPRLHARPVGVLSPAHDCRGSETLPRSCSEAGRAGDAP